MRLFDDEKIGCYLDTFTPRVEVAKDGTETKLLDLTLRVQPLTPAIAVSIDPDVRTQLFSLHDGTPKPKVKSVAFNLPVPKQHVDVYLLPESDTPTIAFFDVEIDAPRAHRKRRRRIRVCVLCDGRPDWSRRNGVDTRMAHTTEVSDVHPATTVVAGSAGHGASGKRVKKTRSPLVMLICEGRCNPGIKDIDERVRHERSRFADKSGPIIDGLLLDDVKRLIHTAHRHVGGNRYSCKQCGVDRQYGH